MVILGVAIVTITELHRLSGLAPVILASGGAWLFGSVRSDEDSFDRARKAIITTQDEFLHQRREGVVLNRRCQRNTCVHRDVPHRAAETETVDQLNG